MIRLLQLLIFGHAHKWVTIREINFTDDIREYERTGVPTGRKYTCQCETCGKIRTFIV